VWDNPCLYLFVGLLSKDVVQLFMQCTATWTSSPSFITPASPSSSITTSSLVHVSSPFPPSRLSHFCRVVFVNCENCCRWCCTGTGITARERAPGSGLRPQQTSATPVFSPKINDIMNVETKLRNCVCFLSGLW